MLASLGPLLAGMVLAQAPSDRTLPGEVIDDQGKPVAGARVIYHEPPLAEGKVKALDVRTETDARGRFSLNHPATPRNTVLNLNLWVNHPGWAITAERFSATGPALVLRRPQPLDGDARPVRSRPAVRIPPARRLTDVADNR